MEEEVDYTSDRNTDRGIFAVGGFSGDRDWQGTSGPLLSGRGPEVFTGPVDDVGLDGNDYARISNPIPSPFSVGLEGLASVFKNSEGMAVKQNDLVGLLGRTLSPQTGSFMNFPTLSTELPVKGFSPVIGDGLQQKGLVGKLGSFSVGALVVFEAGRGSAAGQAIEGG